MYGRSREPFEDLKSGERGNRAKIPIAVPDGDTMMNCDGGDQAVERGADRETLAPPVPIDLRGFREAVARERIAEAWKSQKGIAHGAAGGIMAETLQDLL